MSAPADVHYARTRDGIDIAYTVFGEGPDLLLAPGFVTHLDLMWDFPPFQRLAELSHAFRLIVLDKRGTGLSDRSLGFGSVEERAEDIRAVLDAVASEQAILYGISESGPLCTYFAASHPGRVRALILYGTMARFDQSLGLAVDPSRGEPFASQEELIEWMAREWGKGEVYNLFLSAPPDAEAARRVLARYERSACTPQMCREIMTRNVEMNVEAMLSAVAAPTLVMHCARDPLIHVEHGRRLARGIPGAKFVEIDGDFHGSWKSEDVDKLSVPLAEFLATVVGSDAQTPGVVSGRELATVLFTDIVGSTKRAGELGDATWRSLLDRFEEAASRAVSGAEGRLVKTTGDGMLATFGGPSYAVGAARALQDASLSLGVSVRAGLHTGEIERRGDDIGGIGVHIAARISALAQSGEILVSRTARDLAVGSRIEFEDRGTHALKGVSQDWQVFAVC